MSLISEFNTDLQSSLEEAEDSVLGSLLVDASSIPDVIHLLGTDAQCFNFQRNALIYEAILAVFAEKQSAPIECVVQKLIATPLAGEATAYERVGGRGHLLWLHDYRTETENTLYYAELVWEFHQRTRLHKMGKAFQDVALDPLLDFSDRLAHTQEILQTYQSVIHTANLESLTHTELAQKEFPPVKWIIPELLHQGLTVFGGPAKIGKSFFALNVAVAVASGGVAFSKIPLEKARNVTYLCFDDPIELLKERLDLHTDTPLETLHIIPKTHAFTLDATGIATLSAHIDTTHSELVIVDTLAHVKPQSTKKGTAYDTDYDVMMPIQALAQEKNIAILVITHTRKTLDPDNPYNELQGSTAMQAASAINWLLKHDSGSKTFFASGGRVPSQELSFTLDAEHALWILEGDATQFHQSHLRKSILDLLEHALDGLTPAEIADGLGEKDNLIRKTLRLMVTDGEVYQPRKRGPYYFQDEDDGIKL